MRIPISVSHLLSFDMVWEEITLPFVFIASRHLRWNCRASFLLFSSPIHPFFCSIDLVSFWFPIVTLLFLQITPQFLAITFQLWFLLCSSIAISLHRFFRVSYIPSLTMANPPANHDDSYYLHPSKNPGLVLISQPLTEDNFSSWHRTMLMALDRKNKVGFIDGSLKKPKEDQPKYRV